MAKRYLITDYDDTAFSYTSRREDHLSQAIVDMAKNGDYDGFYGCTHRTYSTIDILKVRTLRSVFISLQNARKNFATYLITEHFAKATSLPLQAVSTVDDVIPENRAHGVGYGYDHLLKPYEESGTVAASDQAFMRKRDAITYPSNKNVQLLQIAEHAVNANPGSSIVLDFVDDSKENCLNALEAIRQPDWPADVSLNIYHYQPDGKLVLLQEVEDLLSESTSPLQENSIFTERSSSPTLFTPTLPRLEL